jgi:hypothetical protein
VTAWLVINGGGIAGVFTDEVEARQFAEATSSLLVHVPVDEDYRDGRARA